VSYRAIGVGPGPGTIYRFDLPFPWGDNTPVAIPIDQMVQDAWVTAKPLVDGLINDIEMEAERIAPDIARKVIVEAVQPAMEAELTAAIAQAEVLRDEALKALLAASGMIVIAVGLAAYWVRRG